MKKILFLSLALCCAFVLRAQDTIVVGEESTSIVPNYDSLRIWTADPQSPYYYPVLVERFLAADTTLSLEQVHAFYYGHVVQPDFSPYKHFDELEEADKLLHGKKKPSKKNILKAIALCDKVIARKPTELPAYMKRFYAFYLMRQHYGISDRRMAECSTQLNMLLDAIIASGSGQDFESAMHVNTVAHAYLVMSMIGVRPQGQSLQFDHGQAFDVYTLMENKHGLNEFYVNVTPCLSSLQKGLSGGE